MLKESKMKCMISMDRDFNETLKKLATKENRSLSNLITTILKDYVENKKE